MTKKRKAISDEGLSDFDKEDIKRRGIENQVASSGLSNQSFLEPVPKLDTTNSEVVYSNRHNAWIILGRDRSAGIESGYGGLGNTGAGSIDLVVGRMAGTTQGPQASTIVAPNFFTDAARIHISQKTDVDKNFGLVGDAQMEARSAIGIKADAVRMIGREGIKLVTGKGKNTEGGQELNSQGGTIETVPGIELIAGNDVSAESLEPIVKAYALNDVLVAIVDSVDKLINVVNENAKLQSQINYALAAHSHEVPLGIGVTKTTPPLIAGTKVATKESTKMSNVHHNLYKIKMNSSSALRETYLTPGANKWFGSRFNKTN